ncbi:DNA-directed RNA polymerase I subunit RPA43 [Aspergillus melleus]|uniref:DNA-directed RNA polymerase I subunit RPA43 n=1 Tax=Aspergillus melleus TaxID=138277 RepID=UPI001E8D7B91|nr:uncharacterized protein LDX57_008816 [Aspergillus melleus]KAH8431157.1 hypothetical protein LDX57_008816 [Aspergillus melleus]
MAVDEMEIDSNPTSHSVQEPEKERKRKHKNKDASSSSPSKKKRKHDANNLIADESSTREKKSKKSSKDSSSKSKKSSKSKSAAASTLDSPYTLTTATLYLPLSPISISPTHALASLMAEHLSPLILTYYAPLKGVVLAYSNPTISSTDPAESSRSASDPNPEPLTLAKTAGEYGVLYVYLTATFLVFRPQRGQILEGWVNVQSEGFLGAVALNLFSVGIERKRLPSDWKWIAPGEYEEGQDDKANGDDSIKTESQNNDNDDNNSSSSEPSTTFDPEKEHFKPITLASDTNPLLDTDATAAESDESAAAQGYFQSVSGHRVRGTVRFRVVDVDVIPGAERDRGFMSIEGTMLTPEEEAQVVEDERNGVVSSFPGTPRRSASLPIRTDPKTTTAMSGAIPESSSTAAEVEVEVEAEEPEQASPVKKSSSKENKEKKSKSSKSKKKEKEKK